MTDRDETAAHYKDSSKLAVRGGSHARNSNVSWYGWADAAGRARLKTAVKAMIDAYGGVVPMPRVQDMISGVGTE